MRKTPWYRDADWLTIIGFTSTMALFILHIIIGFMLINGHEGNHPKSIPPVLIDTIYVDRYHCDEYGNLLRWDGDTVKPQTTIRKNDEQ